jgi:hypothetical protein
MHLKLLFVLALAVGFIAAVAEPCTLHSKRTGSIFDELTLPARVSQARVDRVRLKHGPYLQGSQLKHRALSLRGGERRDHANRCLYICTPDMCMS